MTKRPRDNESLIVELPAILQDGRRKSTATVERYGERLLARRGGLAQLARLQERK